MAINDENLRLNILGLPIMRKLSDFSSLTHISTNTLYHLSKYSEQYYRVFTIPKKNGNLREIAQPSKRLKGLQAWILVNILNKLHCSNFCKGFERGTSISDNARPHIGANTIVTIDLKDFFPSIRRNYVFQLFRSIGYNDTICTVLTNICCFKGRLPQGGPCSPKLANLVAWRLDMRIQGYVGKRGITYTRYADDLSFSGYNPGTVCRILPTVRKIIESEHFEINNTKTRVAGASRAKRITGLIIGEKNFGIGKRKFKVLRAKLFHLSLVEHREDYELLQHVQGWIAFLKSVDEPRYRKAIKYAAELSQLHPHSLLTKL